MITGLDSGTWIWFIGDGSNKVLSLFFRYVHTGRCPTWHDQVLVMTGDDFVDLRTQKGGHLVKNHWWKGIITLTSPFDHRNNISDARGTRDVEISSINHHIFES